MSARPARAAGPWLLLAALLAALFPVPLFVASAPRGVRQRGAVAARRVSGGGEPPPEKEQRRKAKSRGPWRVLGLSQVSSAEEVKARYRELVKRLHPDSGGASADPERLGRVVRAMAQLGRQGQGAAKAATARTRRPPPPPRCPIERERLRREEAKRRWEAENREIYAGRSRVTRGVWTNYRITLKQVFLDWQGGEHLRVPVRAYKLSDVRRCSPSFHPGGGEDTLDLSVEMLSGTKLQLEEIPTKVVSQVEKLVRDQQYIRYMHLERIKSSQKA